jgi:AraC-like DNA-binding protein
MSSPTPCIALQLVEPLLELLTARGIDANAMLRASGAAPAAADSASAMMPLAAYVALFERAASATGDPHLGLHLGRFDEPGNLGALGYLFMSGASLLDAFEGFGSHLAALQEGTTNRLQIDGDAVTFHYRINDDQISPRRQDSEYSISAMHNLTRLYSDSRIRPRMVCFEHRQAGRYSAYRDLFGCEIYFGQPLNALVYDRNGFNVRSRRRSRLLNPIIASHLDTLATRRAATRSYRERVTDLLELHLADGRCTQAQIALEMGLSVSTLIRRLRGEGVRFRELLTERRLQSAKRLLSQDDAPVAAVALAVGYAENASFTRAFRRRNAHSPVQFRRLQWRNRER